MGLTIGQTVLWYLTFALEVVVFGLAVRKRLYAHLPIFTSYLALLILRATFIFIAYCFIGYRSRFAFYSYWLSEGILLLARGASIGELVWAASRWYAGLRRILRSLLPTIVCALLAQASWAVLTRTSRIPVFVLTVEQSLELTAAVALVAFLVFSRFYDISSPRLQRLVATGLLFYSLIQITNNAISKYGVESHFHWWEGVRSTSFSVALIIWLIALMRPLRDQAGESLQTPVDLERSQHLLRRGPPLLRVLYNRLHDVNGGTDR